MDWLKAQLRLNKNVFLVDRHIGKKILAVVISTALWMVANLQYDVEKNISVDVNYVNLSAGLIVANNPPEKLSVRVRGPRSQLMSMSPQKMFFTIDLSNVSQGMSMFELTTDQIKPPREVQVTGISPSEIKVEVDKLRRKDIMVKPSVGAPAMGYEIVGEPVVNPKRIKIEGPSNLLKQIKTITTDQVSVDKEKSKFTIEVQLRPPYPLVSIVGENTVKISIDVKEKTLVKEFNDLDINFVNFDGLDYEIEGNIVTELAFEGPFSIINNLNSDDIEFFVDGSGIKSRLRKEHRLKVNVNYPHKDILKITKKFPKTIRIRLR